MAAKAKKVKRTITEEEIEPDAPGADEEKLDDDIVRALTELEGAEEIRWQIHRQSQPDPGYCGECSTAELSLLYIAETYGAGRYRIKGIRPDGTYYKSGRLTITKGAKKPDGTPDLIAALKGGGNLDQSLLLAMMQSNTAIVTAALSKPDKPDKEFPWKEIIVASPLMLTALKELFAKKDESGEAMDKFLKTLTIVEKLRGDDSKGGSNWTDLIRDALSSLPALVSRGSQPAAAQSVPRSTMVGTPNLLQPTAVAGATMASPASASVDTPEAVMPSPEIQAMDFFKRKFEELIDNAAHNKDPELRAELLLDDLPAFVTEAMVQSLLMREDWFERLCEFDARVANYHGWFSDLRTCVLQLLSNDDQSTGEKTNESAGS